jgi:hypothetical protein
MKKFTVTVILTVMLVLVCTSAFALKKLEPQQEECIQMAFEEGSKLYLYGDTWGETAASIAWQESHCGYSKFAPHGVVVGDMNSNGKPRSLGWFQVQVPTARHMGKVFPQLFKDKYGDRIPSDEELTIDLLIDKRFNVKVGVHYFAWLMNYRNGNWNKAVLSYNRGTGQNLVDVNDYVRKVRKWRKTVIIPYLKEVGAYE